MGIHKILNDIESFIIDHPTICMAFILIGLLEVPVAAITLIILYLLSRIML